jgi:hypothetical protein
MLTRRSLTVHVLGAAFVAVGATPSAAAPDLATQDGFAIGGYDSVAYWNSNKALKGHSSFSFEWRRANWIFATAENRDAFAAAPEKYAPVFNGYCAYCLGDHRLVPGVGEFWSISDGKLYLQATARERYAFDAKPDYHVRRAAKYWATLP